MTALGRSAILESSPVDVRRPPLVAVAPGTSLRRRALALFIGVCVVLLAASVVRGSTAAGAGHRTLQGELRIARGHEDAAVASGTITVMPDGVTCPPACVFTYQEGESKTLTANPDPGSFFYRWEHVQGTSTCAASNFEAICTVTLTGTLTDINAIFLPDPALSVGVTGNGTAVGVSAGVDCESSQGGGDACFYAVTPGSTVTLTPKDVPGSTFVGWSVPECPGTGDCTVVIDSQLRSVVGTFSPMHLKVIVDETNTVNGTVTGGPIACPPKLTCEADFPAFAEVTLTASSDGFVRWHGACQESGTAQSCTIRLSGDDVVGAEFGGAPPPTIVPPRIPVRLEVKKTGDGAGTVTSARSRFSEAIDCGAGTGCDAFFQQGETAALVADPAPGSSFAGWDTPSNLCSTNLNCRFEVMRVSRLDAKFVRNAQPPPPPQSPPPRPPQPAQPPPCSARKMGGPGADRLDGGPGSDAIFGRAGNDRIRGLGGNDCLFGERGNDVVGGGPGGDVVNGGRGADELHGGPGRDTLRGERGRDRIFARDGARDVIQCGSSRDSVRADRIDRVSGCESVRRR